MNLTVNQLLTIVGRLDDSPGFDTPRERFRRLLSERMTDAESARVVIQECREMSGEQNHRALQDAVVLTGTLLGFRTTFGAYQHDPGAAPIGGQWESRRRLRVIVSVCAGQMAGAELDALSRAVREGTDPNQHADTPRVGLLVVTPFYAAKARLEEMFRTRAYPELRLISLAGILRMADMVAAGQLMHDEVLEVLNPDVTLDSALDLLDRRRTGARVVDDGRANGGGAPPPAPPPTDHCWIAAIRLEPDVSATQFVDAVIAKRRLLAINPAAHSQGTVEPGDSICVCIAGAGFMADAQVAALVTDGSGGVRNGERFAQVLRLVDVEVYGEPVVPAPELIRKLELAPSGETGAVVTRVSRHEFELATRTAARSEKG
jgi:hypothetical protein